MGELVVLTGSQEGRVCVLEEVCVIGRHVDCDIQLEDDAVSRRHARITLEGDEYYVEDLGSSNGTFVNGSRIQRAKLSEGDTIKVSHCVMAFRVGARREATAVTVVEGPVGIGEPPRHSSTITQPAEAGGGLLHDTTAVRSLDQLQGLHEKLLTVTRFSKEVRSTLNLKALLGKVLGLLFEIFPQAQRGFVMLRDDAGKLRPVASKNLLSDGEIEVSSTVLDVATREKKAILSNNPFQDTRFASGRSIVTHGMRSLMVSPLLSGEEAIGVVHIDTTRDDRPFSTDDLALFSGLADQAAVAVSNAHLHERIVRRQRLEQELEIAQRVQESFLPARLPESDVFELAFHYAQARQVGGDFYDMAELPEGRLAVGLGDVSGKGIPAALLMAKTISEMRVSRRAQESPAAVLSMVNSMMLGSIAPEMFVTGVVCFFDPATGEAVISDAGHNPPVVKKATGEAAFVEVEKGFPLGVVEEGQYGDFSLRLAGGETLLFYTDGLTDAVDDSGVQFGNERLLAAVGEAMGGAEGIVESVVGAVREFAGLAKPFDDMTVIAISPK